MQFDGHDWNQPFPTTNYEGAASVPPLKRHAACDECRKRKLKCSGEATGCGRCLKQSLVCHYSLQKQMGRPPKKRMREENDISIDERTDQALWSDLEDSTRISPSETTRVPEVSDLFPPVYTIPMRMPQPIPNLLSTNDNHHHLWQLDHCRQSNPIFATSGPWPDFSSVSAATACPFAIPSDLTQSSTPPLSPPSPDINNNSSCSCLSYLYLCLSHLSSLAPFPISQHTLCSLFIAAKTARAVIRCEVCPTSFALSMQNVMFTGTLLNVIADAWLRVSKTDAEELCRSAAPPDYVAALTQDSSNLSESWKDWLRQTVRSAIMGGSDGPAGQAKCSDSPTLMSLVEEMEARQRRWHQLRDCESLDPSSSWPPPILNDRQEGDLLCLRMLRNVRDVVDKFEFTSHEHPENSIP